MSYLPPICNASTASLPYVDTALAADSVDLDRFAEHFRSVRNNNVDKPVARHFNVANHSISDINVCAISTISGGNGSR